MKEIFERYWPWGVFAAALIALLAAYGFLFDLWFPLVAILVVPLILLIIWQPLAGFCLMIFFIPLEDLTILFPSFTLIKLVGMAAFWGWLVQLFMGKKTFKAAGFFYLLLIYLGWCALSSLWAVYPDQSLERVASLFQLFAMLLLGYNLVENKRDFKWIAGSYLLGAFIAACLGIYNGYLHEFSTRAVICNLQNPNYFARVVGLGLLFGGYFFMVAKNRSVRLLSFTACAVILFAVMLSGSRGAWLAVLATMVTGLVFYRGWIGRLFNIEPTRPNSPASKGGGCPRAVNSSMDSTNIQRELKPPLNEVSFNRRAAVAVLVVLVLFTGLLVSLPADRIPAVITQRAQAFTDLSEGRGTGRLDIWLVGMEITRHNLVKGVGIDNFPYAYTRYFSETEGLVRQMGINKNPHNIFLATVAELGLPGLLLFIYMLVLLWRLTRSAETEEDALLGKLLLVFLVTAGLTAGDQHRKFFWLAMLMPVILAQFGVFKGFDPGGGPVKTLFLAPVFPNRQNPNYGIFAMRMVQSIKTAGLDPCVIAPAPCSPPVLWFNYKWRAMGRIPPRETIDGVDILHPRYVCLPGGRFDYFNMVSMFLAVYPLAKILHRNAGFGVVHSYGLLPAGFVGCKTAQKLGAMSVCTIMGADINVVARKSPQLSSLAGWVLKHTGQMVAVGKDLAAGAAKLRQSPKDIQIVYNGVDGAMFDTTGLDYPKAGKKLGFCPADRIILYVGRVIRQKGVFEMLEAFRRVSVRFPAASLVIVGEGEDMDDLRDAAGSKGISARVRFIGPVPQNELPLWYAASEMVVLLSHHDGVPNVIKEAMSCGRPVIATRTAGIPEIVQDGKTGLLVAPGDIDQAGAAMRTLLNDPGLGRQMGRSAREVINSGVLNWEHTAAAYLRIYERLSVVKETS